jgi:diacylglycerol kinase family enzyme
MTQNYRGKRALVEVDGVPLPRQIILALASNVQLYGGVVRIATEARLDDGVLDLVLLKGAGWWQTAWHLIKVFFGWHRRDPEAEIYRAQTIVIRAARVPVHVDGELIGVTPVEICLLPRALRVLVPPTANRNLFGRAA